MKKAYCRGSSKKKMIPMPWSGRGACSGKSRRPPDLSLDFRFGSDSGGEQEVERVLGAYRAAVRAADEDDEELRQRKYDLDMPTEALGHDFARDRAPTKIETTPRRTHQPFKPDRGAIDAYSTSELKALVRHVRSDGILRTDDELVQECVALLGFRRKGARFVGAILDAVEKTRDGRGPCRCQGWGHGR
ncbi:MAG: hypothetical protein U1E65_21775 [Myxococcota bacterium]